MKDTSARKEGLTMKARLHCLVGIFALFGLQPLSAAEGEVVAEGERFWVVREIRQGMSEADFLTFVDQHNLPVTTPLPDQDLRQVSVDGTDYWLVFCTGRLTYASWNLADNAKFIKSLDQRINNMGFKVVSISVSNEYSDSIEKELPQLVMRLEKVAASYSVTYTLFDENAQVVLEDSGFDESFGCAGDER